MAAAAAASRYERMLNDLQAQPGNNICADCKRHNPRWASHNLGIFLCVTCASMHRKIGTHITKVKSLDQDIWTKEQMENMRLIGNIKSNQKYNPDERRHPPPANLETNDRGSELENFIRSKYEKKAFMGPTTPAQTQTPAAQSYRPSSASASGTSPQLPLPEPSPRQLIRIRIRRNAVLDTSTFSFRTSLPSSVPNGIRTTSPTISTKLGVSSSTLNDMMSISRATFNPSPLLQQQQQLQPQPPSPMNISPLITGAALPNVNNLTPNYGFTPGGGNPNPLLQTNPFPLAPSSTGAPNFGAGGYFSSSPISPVGQGLPSNVTFPNQAFRSTSLPVGIPSLGGGSPMQMQMQMSPPPGPSQSQMMGYGSSNPGMQMSFTGIPSMAAGVGGMNTGLGINTLSPSSPFGGMNASGMQGMGMSPFQNHTGQLTPTSSNSNNPFLQQQQQPQQLTPIGLSSSPSPFASPFFPGAGTGMFSSLQQQQQQQQPFGSQQSGTFGYGAWGGT